MLLFKNVAGTWTLLADTIMTGYFAGGNFAGTQPLLRFSMLGSQLTVFVDSVQQLTATDSSLTTGSVGIRVTAGVGVDNFTATSP